MRTLTSDERKDVINQIQYLHSEAMGMQSAFLGSISLPVGVFALILYYALSMDAPQQATLFVILPFLFSLSIFNLLKYSIKLLGLDAYIRHLERRLNESYQKPLFLWQSHLVYVNEYSLIGGLVQMPSFFAISIFLIYKFFHHLPDCNLFPHAQRLFTVLLYAQGISLFIALVVCLSQYHAVLLACQEIDLMWTNCQLNDFKDGFPSPPTSLRKLYIHKIWDKWRWSKQSPSEDASGATAQSTSVDE